MKRLLALCLIAMTIGSSIARANRIPNPETVANQSGVSPVTVTVIDPHLGTPKKPVAVAYLAFPAPVALSAALGPGWAKAETIAFRARDGFVSRIDAARLTSGKAFLAFARADRAPFTIDNLAQNERNVPLGPYYLVWDNRDDPALRSKGARDWPYQVIDVSVFSESDAALRPSGLDPALEPGLASARKHCLTCHKVNGYGGEKAGDLALIARGLTATDFVRWALNPSSVKPDTTTPALAGNLTEAERRSAAHSIYNYLSRVTVLDDR